MAGKARWTSQHVRKAFLEYFKKCDHKFVPSSSIIPKKGQGTYFVNAGMNQVHVHPYFPALHICITVDVINLA